MTYSDKSPFAAEARAAVGSALLFRVSPRGGSYGGIDDTRRAADLAKEQLSGEEMHAFLLDVAAKAAESAKEVSDRLRWQLIREAKATAVRSDSLSLHQFVTSLESADEPN